ncbi:MAG: tetratricopeptide repeat protein [Acidobacteria bacterium]|nr:tetratricopeptide repeat protein [Acidobacteriota bacterium]MBI3663265.1 tetratricopeptide repeat protein [Acidobacteriota bacterium]
MKTKQTIRIAWVIMLVCAAALAAQNAGQAPGGQQAQQSQQQPQPEFIRQGRELLREGKLDEALAVYRQELQKTPDSVVANNAAGVVLDLMGQYAEARKYFAKAIEAAATPQAKAAAQRAMAMSYAFEGDCKKTVEWEQQVFNYYVSVNDFFQQGEMANEAARVCIEAGELDTAYKWYETGHERGLREPNIKPDRVDLWEFRWAHAQARIAARRGNAAEAQKHVAAAKAALDKGTNPTQAVFFPYLVGYVAFYRGDTKTALEELQKANQNDPFIQCLIAQTYEKMGDKEKALEFYRKAASTTAHNPPAAYARPFAKKKLP